MTKKEVANLSGMTSGVVGQIRRIGMIASEAAGYNEVAQIRHHEEVVACPKDVQKGSCQEEEDPNGIEQRKNSKGATDVEVLEVAWFLQSVEEDAGDQKAGENEEEIDADPTPFQNWQIGYQCDVVGLKDHQKSDGSKSVQ